MQVKCKQCSKIFSKIPSQIRRSKNNFCSRSCSAIYNNTIKPKRKKLPKKYGKCDTCKINIPYRNKYCIYCRVTGPKPKDKTNVQRKCKLCNTDVNKRKTYCNECKQLKKKNRKLYQVPCTKCGVICMREKNRLNKNVFCTRECFSIFHYGYATKTVTLADIYYSNSYKSNVWSKVRGQARSIIKKLNITKCQHQDCNYDKHVEVCHKRAISEFPLDTPISVVNDISNLIVLCPNHHWEFDNQ